VASTALFNRSRGSEAGRFTNAIRLFFELRGKGQTKAQIVVAIAGVVVVAIGHSAIPRVVVPTAAPIHAVRAPKPASVFDTALLLKLSVFAKRVKANSGSA
jgi:hypothetical protein